MWGDRMSKIVKIIILMVAISIMYYSGYKLFGIYVEYKAGNDLYDDFADQFVNIKNNIENISNNKLEANEEGSSNFLAGPGSNDEDIIAEYIDINIDFEALLGINQEILGWIYSANTPMNYPVVQSDDNDYYLRRMIDGTYNTAGSIFMDYRNNKDLSDLNTIIYGHNMKNNSMFGTLDQYKSQKYYEEHSIMYLITPHQTYKLELIAGLVVNNTSEVYDIPQDTESLQTLYDYAVKNSTFRADSLLEEGDRLITLSTCSYENDIARYVIMAKIM